MSFFGAIMTTGKNIAEVIASQHIERVLADGGVIENESLTKSVISKLVQNYGIFDYSEFGDKLPITLHPSIFGYKIGVGSGITIGAGCEKLYSINPSNDAVQATVANQPIIHSHSGDNYYWASRVSGDNISATPGVFEFTPATDTVQLTCKIFTGVNIASNETICQLGSFANFRYSKSGSSHTLIWRGTANAASSSSYTPSSTNPHWVRLVITPTNSTYYWSSDGVSFTALGTVALPTVGTNGSLLIGTGSDATDVCRIYTSEFKNITTTQIVTCDCNDYDRSINQNGWTGGGHSWTINTNTATTGLKGVLVDRTILQGDGITHKISVASIALNQPNTTYVTTQRVGTGVISGRAASSVISNDAINLTINNGTTLNVENSTKDRQMQIIVFDDTTTQVQINNGNIVQGDAGTNDGTYLDILSNGATYGNYTFEGMIVSDSIDNLAQRTKVYETLFLYSTMIGFENSPFYGREFLTQFDDKKGSELLNVVFFGDSWIDTPYRFATPINLHLKTLYGNAGSGFIGASSVLNYTGASVNRFGTWITEYDKNNGIGINKAHSKSVTPTSTIVWTSTDGLATSYEIFYIKTLNGGIFSYKLDSGSKTNIDTNNATTEVGYVTVTGTGVLTIEVETAGANGVSIIGAVFKNSSGLIRSHKVGMNGINAIQAPNGTLSYFTSQLNQLNADVFIILLASNDMGGNINPLASAQGIQGIIDNVRSIKPNCDIVICGSGANGLTDRRYTIDDYQRAYYSVAVLNNCSYINLARITGNYYYANIDGLYEDNLHVNSSGGDLIGGAFVDFLNS